MKRRAAYYAAVPCGIVFLAICVSASFSQPASSPWPMFRHDAGRTGKSDVPLPAVPALKWSYGMSGDKYYFTASPVLDGAGAVYIGSRDKHMYRIDSSGVLAWSYATNVEIQQSAAVSDAGVCFVNDYSRIYKFGHYGLLLWSYKVDYDGLNSSPAMTTTDTAYLTMGPRLFSIASAGTLLWSYVDPAYWSTFASPAAGTDTLYVMSGFHLHSFRQSGVFRWSYNLGATGLNVMASPAVDDSGAVYAGARDNSFYSIDSVGALRWSYMTAGEITSSVALGNDIAYVASNDKALYALRKDGVFMWSYRTPDANFSSPATGEDDAVCYASGNDLYAVSSAGALLWSFATGGNITSSPAMSTNSVYILPEDDALYAISLAQDTPTETPTLTPTVTPTITPTWDPSVPTYTPTETPTDTPTGAPTSTPTAVPTASPTPIRTPAPTITPHLPATGHWLGPEIIDTQSGTYVPQLGGLAFDGEGNAIVTYAKGANCWRNYAIRFSPASGWSAPERIDIEPHYTSNSSSAGVNFAPDGSAIAVWTRVEYLYANRYVPGSGWSGPEIIDTQTGSYYPCGGGVVFDTGGNAIVMYAKGTNCWRSYAIRYVAGSGWTAPERIDVENFNANVGGQYIQYAPDDSAMAVWTIDESLYANKYVPGSGWSGPEIIDTQSGPYYPYIGQLAFDTQGNAILTYAKGTNCWRNYAMRYIPGSGWTAPELIDVAPSYTSNSQSAGISFAPDNSAMATWLGPGGLYTNWYLPGSGWTGPEIIDDTVYSGAAVDFDSSGSALAVFSKYTSCTRHYARRYVPGSGWSGFELIDVARSNDNSAYPQLSFAPDGSAIVVWTRLSYLYANRYVPDPIYPLRVTFQPESSAIPSGLIMDYGAAYGRYGILGYGWR